MQLPQEKVKALLQPGGAISLFFDDFETRPEQISMLQDVLEAYNSHKIALIEAGTGCGKSMAYLIPALLFASQHQERTVISTNTIQLQEQLLHKDIPLLVQALSLPIKIALVKGMNNYLCLRKLDDAMEERLLYTEQEIQEIDSIAMQQPKMKEGSKHELKILPSGITWERVGAEQDTCTNNQCPHYQNCYFFKARKECQDAQILIINHHLLFADLAIRASSNDPQGGSILPSYNRLIIDEAHHIEDIATDYFAKKVSRLQLMKTLSRLLAEKGAGKLPLLKDKIAKQFVHGFPNEVQSIIQRLTIDLPGSRKDILNQVKDTFESLSFFLHDLQEPEEETKFRFREAHSTLPQWKEKVIPHMNDLIRQILNLEQTLKSLEGDIEQLKNEKLNETTKGTRHEIMALSSRLSHSANTLETLIQPSIPENQVRWIEHSSGKIQSNTGIVDASLDLSRLFVEQLFHKFQTVILSSATLTTQRKFNYFKERFGLNDSDITPRVKESLYPSPFNYFEQALVVIPTDLPQPSDPQFLSKAAKVILDVVEASRGGAFILFTSYSMLKTCFEMMKSSLDERKFNLFKQGDMPRGALLKKFIESPRGILFGTDSFWEGVDVAGDKLRAVIIVKLPFKVPTEPIIQARMEQITLQGKDPFREYSLPQAIVKFKQGFGRLIRGKKDRGIIVVLDTRLLNKNYGKLFLKSLPKCQEAVVPQAEIKPILKTFFQKRPFPKP